MRIKNFRFLCVWLIMPISLLLLRCTPKTGNCDEFKTGNYEYRSNGLHYTITRNDSIQTEVDTLSGDVTKTSIRWISDCSYELKMLESTAVYPEEIEKMRRKAIITAEIVHRTDTYYIYDVKSNINDRVLTDTLWIVKE